MRRSARRGGSPCPLLHLAEKVWSFADKTLEHGTGTSPQLPETDEKEDTKMPVELDQVHAHHQATKHNFASMAPGPKGMDWWIELAPFWRYGGAELVELDRPKPRTGSGKG